MTTQDIINLLRKHTSSLHEQAASRLEYFQYVLEELSKCDFNDDNCANLGIASARIRNIAEKALSRV